MMKYQLEEVGFSTDYSFPHLIVEPCDNEILWDDLHPLVNFVSDDDLLGKGFRLGRKPTLMDWYTRNTSIRCSPRLFYPEGGPNHVIIYAFATKDQAFRFKMYFDG